MSGRAARDEAVGAGARYDALHRGDNRAGSLARDVERRAANVSILGVALRVEGDGCAGGSSSARRLQPVDVLPVMDAQDVADVGGV